MIVERVERRILGAIEFVDAWTGARVRDALTLDAPRLRLTRNASSLYVIRDADGLAAYTEAFDKPPVVAADGYALVVSDPQRRYLARSVRVMLPRKDAAATDPDSFLNALRIPLYPSMARNAEPAWPKLRAFVFVTDGAKRVGVANALLRLTPAPAGLAPAIALTDANGEAFLAVPGAPPVLSGTPPTRLFDAALLVALDAQFARRGDAKPPLPVPDPDRILERVAASDGSVQQLTPAVPQLSAGLTQRVELEVTL
jgi:hypothetical protein